jgi:fucose permease
MPATGARRRVLLVLSFLGFMSLGLPDGLLGVAWPSVRVSFSLPLDALGGLLLATTAGYVLSSFASGRLVARMGVGALLAGSCLATAVSLFGYASAPSWIVMVGLGVLAGLGAGAIDAGINTYAATHHSARTLSLLHASYGLGTASGPVIMTSVLMAGFAWQRGYAIVGVAQLALALCFGASRALWPSGGPGAAAPASSAPIGSTLRLRVTQLGLVAFFLYVGLEATAGAWIFSVLSESRGVPMAAAGAAVSVYWGSLMAGRLVFALLPSTRPPNSWLRPCIGGVAVGSALLALGSGHAATLAGAAVLGFAAGPVFPSLIATTPLRLDRAHTANAVGIQVAASAIGQALLPALVGVLAERYGLEVVPRALLCVSVLLLAVHHRLESAAPVREAAPAGVRADRAVEAAEA